MSLGRFLHEDKQSTWKVGNQKPLLPVSVHVQPHGHGFAWDLLWLPWAKLGGLCSCPVG